MIDPDQTMPKRRRAEFSGRRVASGSLPGHDFFYCVVEAPSPKKASGERRGEKRLRTHLRDGVVMERRVFVDCRISDRSNVGARLQLDTYDRLPRMFVLSDPASKTRFAATLVWQVGREAGVSLKPLEARQNGM